MNGGVCNEGNCTCPDGYTGQYCQTAGAPVVSFTQSETSGQAPLSVNFESTSKYVNSYKWEILTELGTPITVTNNTSQNFTYTFTTSGKYIIKLTGTNGTGSVSRTSEVNVTGSTQPCEAQHFGYYTVNLQQGSPYRVYIDGTYKQDMTSYSTQKFTVAKGSHTIRLVQISGYVFDPTDCTRNFYTNDCSDQSWTTNFSSSGGCN